jgi:hypothetical protein
MEQISFVIPFGDTTSPEKIAEQIAKDLQFLSWFLKKEEKGDDDGVAATRFVVIGWTTKWEMK